MKEQNTQGDAKIHRGWAMFDWANSAYALIISTAIFPPFLYHNTPDNFQILGIDIQRASLLSFAISFAYLLIAGLSPIIGGIADYSGRRRMFMKFFTYLGGMSCIALFWFDGPQRIYLGLTGFILATIGYSGSLMVYNSFLPLITTEDNYDKLSAKGFTYGYIGSVLLLVFCLIVITFPTYFLLPAQGSLPVRISFLLVGIWWIAFAQIPFKVLPESHRVPLQKELLTLGWKEIIKVAGWLRQMQDAKKFLLTFFVYTAGVQTVLFLATTFAESELNMGTSKLILLILLLQIIAIGGAYLFAYVSKIKGNLFSIRVMLLIWILVCILAYQVQEEWQFFLIAGLVGSVMGGIQSLSRSTFSKMIQHKPREVSSFFSFFDVLEKVAILLGTASFGLAIQLTGDIRNSVVVIGLYFVLGWILSWGIKMRGQATSH
jgi:MFS transporter, UMF1 family